MTAGRGGVGGFRPSKCDGDLLAPRRAAARRTDLGEAATGLPGATPGRVLLNTWVPPMLALVGLATWLAKSQDTRWRILVVSEP